jgi:hypothetical protein
MKPHNQGVIVGVRDATITDHLRDAVFSPGRACAVLLFTGAVFGGGYGIFPDNLVTLITSSPCFKYNFCNGREISRWMV